MIAGAGCATDLEGSEPETSTETQAVGGSCTILRPVSWWGFDNGHWVTCIEPKAPPITIPNGHVYLAISTGGLDGFGVGEFFIKCDDGELEPVGSVCEEWFDPF